MPFDDRQDENQVIGGIVEVEEEVRKIGEVPHAHLAKPRVQSGVVASTSLWLLEEQVTGGFDVGNKSERDLFTAGLIAVVEDALLKVFVGFLIESEASLVH